MNKNLKAATVAAALLTGGALAQTTTVTPVTQTTTVTVTPTGLPLGTRVALEAGFAGGFGGGLFLHIPGAFGDFGVRLGGEFYNLRDPLNDNNLLISAYRALIDDDRESGRSVIVSADGVVRLTEDQLRLYAFAGPRYHLWSATITGRNDNVVESRTFSANQFGLGGGIMAEFPLDANLALSGSAGVDYYFRGPVTGRYSDGTAVTFNPGGSQAERDVYTAFNNPQTLFKLRAGVTYRF